MQRTSRSAVTGAIWVLVGAIAMATHWQTVLGSPPLASHFVSDGLRRAVLGWPVWPGIIVLAVIAWSGGALLISRVRRGRYSDALGRWGMFGGAAWALVGLWLIGDFAADVGQQEWLSALLNTTVEFWQVAAWSAWLGLFGYCLTGADAAQSINDRCAVAPISDRRASGLRRWTIAISSAVPVWLWLAMALYIVVFFTMNRQLWNTLRLPHGDSSMYEEHLWNLLHGKGFRSYLDNGRLFLGEHIQVIHLLLIPVYVLWPNHLTLEFCQSLALASGAIPVYWIAARHIAVCGRGLCHGKPPAIPALTASGPCRGALALALAYLLYVPMQFLDIAIDLKTFRPNAFEIPLLLFALDALERGRWKSFWVLLALVLSCQEDAAAVLAPLGVWMAVIAGWTGRLTCPTGLTPPPARWRHVAAGLVLAAGSFVYVFVVVRYALPWFRGGGDVHFANYFSDLGGSSGEIAANFFRNPERFFARFWNLQTLLFALALLVPLGGLPLLSPSRLLVAVPLFGLLCLSDITNDPRHHFHAPLVPIVLWAAAAGMANGARLMDTVVSWATRRKKKSGPGRQLPAQCLKPTGRSLPVTPGEELFVTRWQQHAWARFAPVWVVSCSLLTGAVLGLSPLSIVFWDAGSNFYWRRQYVADERAAHLPRVLELVPPSARVASTDFIHPRFTHYERSYDYSSYRPDPPADTDFIVIDTRHPYSTIHAPREIPQYRQHPADWKVLLDDGYFIVLKRRR